MSQSLPESLLNSLHRDYPADISLIKFTMFFKLKHLVVLISIFVTSITAVLGAHYSFKIVKFNAEIWFLSIMQFTLAAEGISGPFVADSL